MLARQPLEGRSKGGGLRFGEMERDAVSCHGASAVLVDRMMTNSDAFEQHACTACGSPGHTAVCATCGGTCEPMVLPYSTKLMFQEFGAMHVKATIRPHNCR